LFYANVLAIRNVNMVIISWRKTGEAKSRLQAHITLTPKWNFISVQLAVRQMFFGLTRTSHSDWG